MTRHFGIIAHPVDHSLSPAMHNAAFKALNIDADFQAFDVLPEQLSEFLKNHVELEGLAVSLPHKQGIIPYLDEVDTEAQAIGAVNTIYLKNGKRCGANTDAQGFIKALEEVIPDLSKKNAMVLGAGGAARAIVAALVPRVEFVTIINRTVPKGVELAKEFHCRYGGKMEDLVTETPDLLINTTCLGLEDTDPEVVPRDFLKPEMVVFDSVYRKQGETPFIQRAKQIGAKTIDGKRMLLHQGMLQFELWTGQKAPQAVMEAALNA